MLLEQNDHDLILLARQPNKLTEEMSMGATVTRTDLRDRSSLLEPLSDADAFFFLIPPFDTSGASRKISRGVVENVTDAIEQSKLKRVVLLSSLGAHHVGGTGPVLGLHDAEGALRGMDKDVAFLRVGYLMENCLWSMDSILERGVIELPISGHVEMSFVATKDVATKVVELLNDTEWKGTHIRELVGPVMTFEEAASIIGQECGREIRHRKQTAADIIRQVEAGILKFHVDYIPEHIEVFECMEKGMAVPEFPESAEHIAITSFAEFVRTELLPLIGNTRNPESKP